MFKVIYIDGRDTGTELAIRSHTVAPVHEEI